MTHTISNSIHTLCKTFVWLVCRAPRVQLCRCLTRKEPLAKGDRFEARNFSKKRCQVAKPSQFPLRCVEDQSPFFLDIHLTMRFTKPSWIVLSISAFVLPCLANPLRFVDLKTEIKRRQTSRGAVVKSSVRSSLRPRVSPAPCNPRTSFSPSVQRLHTQRLS